MTRVPSPLVHFWESNWLYHTFNLDECVIGPEKARSNNWLLLPNSFPKIMGKESDCCLERLIGNRCGQNLSVYIRLYYTRGVKRVLRPAWKAFFISCPAWKAFFIPCPVWKAFFISCPAWWGDLMSSVMSFFYYLSSVMSKFYFLSSVKGLAYFVW